MIKILIWKHFSTSHIKLTLCPPLKCSYVWAERQLVSDPGTTVCNRKEMTSPRWNQRGALGMQNLIILIRITP